MSTIGIRQSAVQAMTPLQRKLLRMICTRLDLGEPALYEQANGTAWYVFDDHRISFTDIAALARLAVLGANLEDFETREELRQELLSSMVIPENLGDDPFAEVLAANEAPMWLRAAASVPTGLTVVSAGI